MSKNILTTLLKKIILVSTSIIAMLVTITLLVFVPDLILKFQHHSKNAVLLLLPDLNSDPKLVQLWKDTAKQEGISLVVMTDNEFRLPINQQHINFKGIILPDTLHARMSGALANNLQSYVSKGGHLMLVYDAGTANLRGQPYKSGALFSHPLHVDYGPTSQGGGVGAASVGQSKSILYQLGIEPKHWIKTDRINALSSQPFYALSSSDCTPLSYQHFITKPIKADIPLLLTTPDNQFIAGVSRLDKGDILFINLPLTYLARAADPMPLQVFLRYFAIHSLGLSLNSNPAKTETPPLIDGCLAKDHLLDHNPEISIQAPERIKLVQTKPNKTPLIMSRPSPHPTQNKVPCVVPVPITGFIEGGDLYSHLTSDYGIWSNQYLRGFAHIDNKNSVGLLVSKNYEYKEHAEYISLDAVHIFNEDWYTNFSFGGSNQSIYVPKYYVAGKVFRKGLANRSLVAYLGIRAYKWRPIYSTEDINPGFIYYFQTPWIIELGTYINRSNPGNIYSASVYTAITQGRNKEHYLTLRLGVGKEAYLPLGMGIPAAVGYSSTVITGTWRQWWGCDWGTNIVVENYNNPFYNRAGAAVGLFKEFSI